MKTIKKIMLIMCILLALGGCENKENSVLNSIDVKSEDLTPVDGGTLRISVTRFKTMNPLLNEEESMDYALKLIYEGLFTLDENYNLSPRLADSYQISPDNREIRVSLKSNVTWHDGSQLTADDVLFSFDFLKKNPTTPYGKLIENIDRVSSSGNEIIFTLKNPNMFEPYNLIFPIIKSGTIEGKINPKEPLKEVFKPIGNGRFFMENYVPRKEITLKTYQGYYGKKPHIAEVKIKIVPDNQAQKDVLISSDTDFANIEINDYGKFSSRRFKIRPYTSQNYEGMILNFRSNLIQDFNFRQGLNNALDRKKILKEGFVNNGEVSLIPLIPKNEYYKDSFKNQKYSSEKAKTFFSKVPDLNKKEIILAVDSGNLQRVKTSYLIREILENYNISVLVQEYPTEEYEKVLQSGKYDMALIGWKLPNKPDISFILENGRNYGAFNEDVLKEAQGRMNISSQQDGKKVYQELQSYFADQMPYVGFVVTKNAIVTGENIKGDLKSNEFNIYEGIEDIFIK